MDECPEWEPSSHDGEDLANVGHDYLRVVERVGRDLEDGVVAAELRLIALILASKCARLTHALPLERGAPDREDTVLTLLVIDQLEKQSAAALMAAVGSEDLGDYRRARKNLRRRIDHHLESVRAAERALLERMIAVGRAPSPFCVVNTRES